jgi:hypothetical protein
MKIALLMVLATGIGDHAKATNVDRVSVCVEDHVELGPEFALARHIVAQMFNGIGVIIEWHRIAKNCPSESILILFETGASSELLPLALAYTQPYKGTQVHIFLDRVRTLANGRQMRDLLAHVMAHEIAHLLQGTVRHSDRGVMKARWDSSDYFQMGQKPLEFTPSDIQSIHSALEERNRQTREN